MGMNMKTGFADRMTFAWEDKDVAKDAVRLAKSALAAADVVVVIGYSFPAFNRFVDTELIATFQAGRNRKRLVIQNPSLSREDLINMFDIDEDAVDISVDTNTNQFHLPNELFIG
jgi:hypothetical protein